MEETATFVIDVMIAAAFLIFAMFIYLLLFDQETFIHFTCAVQTHNAIDQAACELYYHPVN